MQITSRYQIIDAPTPSRRHASVCQMTLYDRKGPACLTYRFAASIASALQVTRTDTLYWLARSAAGRMSPRWYSPDSILSLRMQASFTNLGEQSASLSWS